ncbi:MAG: hypothetical protein Q7I99_04555 [Acholeplasmataceae bacterium]|nr:hypothetical protein [Acholeplasmataceae bacterium]
MRKTRLVLLMILIAIVLTACDFDEKSFQVLGDGTREIPSEVTRDFTLPTGYYADFIWTSNREDVIRIEGSEAIVIQHDEDVDVTITATVNRTYRSFVIKVLKIGSAPALFERAQEVKNNFMFFTTIEFPFILNTTENDVLIDYYGTKDWRNDYKLLKTTDGSTWFVPSKDVPRGTSSDISISFGGLNGNDEFIYVGQSCRYSFTLNVDNTNPLQHLFNIFNSLVLEFEGEDYPFRISQSFGLPKTSVLDNNAHTEWSSENEDVLEISIDGSQAIVKNPIYTTKFNLIVSITVESTSIDVIYPVIIIPKS